MTALKCFLKLLNGILEYALALQNLCFVNGRGIQSWVYTNEKRLEVSFLGIGSYRTNLFNNHLDFQMCLDGVFMLRECLPPANHLLFTCSSCLDTQPAWLPLAVCNGCFLEVSWGSGGGHGFIARTKPYLRCKAEPHQPLCPWPVSWN